MAYLYFLVLLCVTLFGIPADIGNIVVLSLIFLSLGMVVYAHFFKNERMNLPKIFYFISLFVFIAQIGLMRGILNEQIPITLFTNGESMNSIGIFMLLLFFTISFILIKKTARLTENYHPDHFEMIHYSSLFLRSISMFTFFLTPLLFSLYSISLFDHDLSISQSMIEAAPVTTGYGMLFSSVSILLITTFNTSILRYDAKKDV